MPKKVVKETKKVEKVVKAEKVAKPMEKKMKDKMKKTITGNVVSVKMKNTVIVSVERMVAHKRYGKLLRVTKRFKADTNGMEVKEGDTVVMEQTRPMSKTKFFKLVSKGENK